MCPMSPATTKNTRKPTFGRQGLPRLQKLNLGLVRVSESLEHEITAPPAVEHEVVPAGLHQELRRGCYLSQTEADHWRLWHGSSWPTHYPAQFEVRRAVYVQAVPCRLCSYHGSQLHFWALIALIVTTITCSENGEVTFWPFKKKTARQCSHTSLSDHSHTNSITDTVVNFWKWTLLSAFQSKKISS